MHGDADNIPGQRQLAGRLAVGDGQAEHPTPLTAKSPITACLSAPLSVFRRLFLTGPVRRALFDAPSRQRSALQHIDSIELEGVEHRGQTTARWETGH